MKRKLAFLFICLLMVTIGIGCMVYQMNKHPVKPYPMSQREWTLYQMAGKPFSYTDDGMGLFAGLITFGIGTGVGVPLIIRSERRKNNQIRG